MITLLEDIWHGILDIPYLIVSLLIESFNGWMMILGLLLKTVLAVLPSFPSIPTLDGSVLAGVAYFLPISSMLAVFATFVTAFVIYMGVSVALRWAKGVA